MRTILTAAATLGLATSCTQPASTQLPASPRSRFARFSDSATCRDCSWIADRLAAIG